MARDRFVPRVPVQCIPLHGDDPAGQGLAASLARIDHENLAGGSGTVIIGRTMSPTTHWHGDTAAPQNFQGAGSAAAQVMAQHDAALPSGQAPPALRNDSLLDALYAAQGG